MFIKMPSLITKASKKVDLRLRSARPQHSLNDHDQMLVSQLHQEGVATTSLDLFGSPGASSMLAIADKLSQELSRRDIAQQSDLDPTSSHGTGLNTYDLIAYPNILLWGMQPRLLKIAESYFQQSVAYWRCTLRRDVPTQTQSGMSLWHKDFEGDSMLKLIIYLNDVGESDGPFEYVPKKQAPTDDNFRHIHNTIPNQDMAQVVSPNHWQQCLGAKGTVVLVDTMSVFHHDSMPKKDRYSLTFAYTPSLPKNNSAKDRQGTPHGESQNWLDIQTMFPLLGTRHG